MKQTLFKKLDKIMNKISAEIHLTAIRDSFMTLIPFLVLAGFCTFFAYVLFDSGSFVGSRMDPELLAQVITIFTRINTGTLGLLSVLMVILVPYNLGSKKRFDNPIMLSITSLAVFFIFMPLEGGYGLFGSGGVLIALIIGLTVAELFMKLAAIDRLKIKIVGNVPPAIIEAFNSVLTVVIMLVGYALVAFTLQTLTGKEIGDLITSVIQAPLVNVGATLPGVILNFLIQTGLFAFGVHPGSITISVFDPIFTAALEQGAIINVSFRDVYGLIGGTGCTMGLVVAILFFSKREEMKSIAKMSAPVSLFNINEPVIFGVPIVFNPIMAIPFILTPIMNMIIAYSVTAIGLVSKCVNYITWSTPPFLNSYIASNGDFRNVILQIALVAIDVMFYLVFFKVYERSLNNSECKEAETIEEDLVSE